MSFEHFSNKKKSFLITTIVFGALLLLLFFIRFWPPSNQEKISLEGGGGGGGITVNFGDSDLGSGSNFKSEELEIKNQSKAIAKVQVPEDPILSQQSSDEETVVIPAKEKTPTPKPILREEPKLVVIKPKVSNNTNDALASIMNGSNKGGDGNDKTAGNKGKANGSLSSQGYYGTGGSGGGAGGGNGTGNGIGSGSGYGTGSGSGSGGGSGSGYSLGNRKAIAKPSPQYVCNEEGKVVVEVSVDRNGKTIAAIPGVKGSTNTARCLLDQAKIAALNTKWDSSNDAPEKQVGKIIYNFSLN